MATSEPKHYCSAAARYELVEDFEFEEEVGFIRSAVIASILSDTIHLEFASGRTVGEDSSGVRVDDVFWVETGEFERSDLR